MKATIYERELQLEQLRERRFQTAVQTMIKHLAGKLRQRLARLEAQNRMLDETQWAQFIKGLHPIEQQILIHHAGEIFQLMRELSDDSDDRPQPAVRPSTPKKLRSESPRRKPRRKEPQLQAN